MTFVTKLRLHSGDRAALEGVVDDLGATLDRKGVEWKGPHSSPPAEFRIPQYRRLAPGSTFDPWEYTVYARRLEIHGGEHIAREVGHMEFPRSVHVEIEVDRKEPLGGRRD